MKRCWLRIRILGHRLGPEFAIAYGILGLALIMLLVAVPLLRLELTEQTAQASQGLRAHGQGETSETGGLAPAGNQAQRLAAFRATLGRPDRLAQHVEQLFDIARQAGLSLDKGRYLRAVDAAGRYQTYQIDLPVRGTYAAVLGFCRQSLLALPFAALDEIALRREQAGNDQLEVTLRFTLFLALDTPVSSAVPSPAGTMTPSAGSL